MTAAFAPSDPVQRIPAVWLKQGGIPASDPTAYDRQSFLEKLATKFIPIDLDFAGLRIVNFDPAIFTVEGFMSPEECQQWQQAALDSGEGSHTPVINIVKRVTNTVIIISPLLVLHC